MADIYKITSPTGKIYIGQSLDAKKHRFPRYKKLQCSEQVRLYNSLVKHGWEKHSFEIIEQCEIEDLNCSERFWQDKFNVTGKKGLNCILQECGEKRREFSEEWKKAHSKRMSGKNNPNFGKSRPDLGLRNKERAKNGEMGGENSPFYGKTGELASFYGKKHTEETKKKMSSSGKGRIVSEETKLLQSISNPRIHSKKVIDTLTLMEFDSIKLAAEYFNIVPITLSNYLNGKRPNRTSMIFKKDYIEGLKIVKNEDNKSKKKVIDTSTGVVYSSIRQASIALGMEYSTLSYNIRSAKINKTTIQYYYPEE